MKPNQRRFWAFAALALLLVLCQGCASLKPSAAMVPADESGGMKISDNARGVIGLAGTLLYPLANGW